MRSSPWTRRSKAWPRPPHVPWPSARPVLARATPSQCLHPSTVAGIPRRSLKPFPGLSSVLLGGTIHVSARGFLKLLDQEQRGSWK